MKGGTQYDSNALVKACVSSITPPEMLTEYLYKGKNLWDTQYRKNNWRMLMWVTYALLGNSFQRKIKSLRLPTILEHFTERVKIILYSNYC